MTMRLLWAVAAPGAAALMLLPGAGSPDSKEERLARHRNLGKAFYENPTTQNEAVDELKKALDLAPDSARERLNYGLALLRAGKTSEGIEELRKVQKQDPKIPHTWFNLGIQFKKSGDYAAGIVQFEQMVKLIPGEPISWYNLGVLYRLTGKHEQSLQAFEKASEMDPNLAAAHFQRYNAYRRAKRNEEAARELQVFQQIRSRQEGAAVPEDIDWSFYAELYDVADPAAADAKGPAPDLKFEDTRLAGSVDPKTAGLTVLDADGDGRPDLLAWSKNGVRLYRHGSELAVDSGLGDLKDVTWVAAADYNNDGLSDLLVLTGGGPFLYLNQKGRFQRAKVEGMPEGRFHAAVWIDYDHDNDLDLILLGEKCVLLQNRGQAGFADRTSDFPFARGNALEGVAFRLIADSKAMDLLVSYADREGVLYRDRFAGKYQAVALGSLPAGSKSLAAVDVNNDSWMDVAFVSESGASLLLNRSGDLHEASVAAARSGIVWADLENSGLSDLVAGAAVSRNLGLRKLGAPVTPRGLPQGVTWTAADFDADGRVDLAAVGADGVIHRLLNRTATGNQWMRIQLAGIKNSKLAPGAEVEVKAGSLYQKKIYTGTPLLVGLRWHKEADTVRITWPNGLIQNETKQPAGRAASYEEAQRLSGSCPMIFTWNGKEFQFITDVLGVAPLGASAGDGRYFPVDHDEYIQIPGEAVAAVEGKYEVRITEELREVSYLDQVKLIAVDHPAGIDVFTNDKFKAPPFPEFRLFGVKRRIYPVAARDDQGRDMLRRLLHRDRTYPDGFPRNYAGVAELHHLDLDFGRSAARGNRAALVLNGWVDWADGSTFLGAAQEREGGLITPYLQVKNAAGEWKTVIEDMGMPAGKPKTIVVDLGGKFLSDSREVRIVTNLCVYWDEIFLTEGTDAPPARLTSMAPETARLAFRGFSKPVIHPRRLQPESFVYSITTPSTMWNPTPGMYTRYGEVRELLSEVDDRLVIMGSGDEARLLFDSKSLPALAPGWKRDFLLLVDGWAKDGDPNTAYSQTVEPLPFHGMSRYPYPPSERYPEDAAHRRYLAEYNTRPALRLLQPLASRGSPAR